MLVECTYLVSADHRSVSVQCPNISALSSQSISKCSTKERPSRRHLELGSVSDGRRFATKGGPLVWKSVQSCCNHRSG